MIRLEYKAVDMYLQSVHGQADGTTDQSSVDRGGNDGTSQTTALLERRHFYMKEENKTGRSDRGEHRCVEHYWRKVGKSGEMTGLE